MNQSMRNQRTGRVLRPVRTFYRLRGLAGALALAAAPLAFVTAAPASARTAQIVQADPGIVEFYRARAGRPLWFGQQSGEAAQQLLALLSSAQIDGVDTRRYNLKGLAKAVRAAWGGDPRAVAHADMMLSQAYVAYANDLKRAPNIGVYYVDAELAPRAQSARSLLEAAAAAPSVGQFIAQIGWMNPTYGQLRSALTSGLYGDEGQRRLLALNLERARTLPSGNGRYIVVNAAAQRLFMYEQGRVVDEMRVVVGKPKNPTPMMSALVRYASLNPYWNVPPDLAAERVAPNVVRDGLSYLRKHGYQVLSDWGDDAAIIDPQAVDWKAVADGTQEVRLRQLPGPGNAMGRMKFMFPNREGVYLHDTPDKQLLTEASRLFSGGCIRLEDAPRLGEWMFGKKLEAAGAKPEQKVELDNPVPVYVTYLTAVPSGSSVAFFDDIYGRDAARLAAIGGGTIAAR